MAARPPLPFRSAVSPSSTRARAGADHPGGAPLRRASFAPPTVSGVATAGIAVAILALAGMALVVPGVFYLVPLPADTDGLTVCLPGLGPLLRVRDDLSPEQEELVYIHEGVHAAQCRRYGSLWYARRASTPQGRLLLEAQALCAEALTLFRRGADAGHLRDGTVAGLVSDYFDGGQVPGWRIAAAVDGACREMVSD